MTQTLLEIKEALRRQGVRPRHRLGQNFLHDANKLRQILEAAGPLEGRTVLEVGPGTGVLSEPLLEAAARLVAVELDPVMVQILRDRMGPDREAWTLIEADVLENKHTINPTVTEALGDEPFCLVANLPYQVASPLIATLLVDHPNLASAVVMVQKEVAERFVAPAGNKTYGTLAVLAQALCRVEIVTTLSASCFWPRPKVDSAVVRLERLQNPLCERPADLSRLLGRLFAQRRKQIGTILRSERPLPESIDASLRPEQLSVEQMVRLSRAMDV